MPPVLATASRDRGEKQRKLHGQSHVELRNPTFTTEVSSDRSNTQPTHITVTIEADRFEMFGNIFNGGKFDGTPTKIREAIAALQRGLDNFDRATSRTIKPDPK